MAVSFESRTTTPPSTAPPARTHRPRERIGRENSSEARSVRDLEDDHGDHAIGVRLVLGEFRELLLVGLPDPLTLPTLRLAGDDRLDVGTDLHRRFRVRSEVVEPVRVGRRAALRRED